MCWRKTCSSPIFTFASSGRASIICRVVRRHPRWKGQLDFSLPPTHDDIPQGVAVPLNTLLYARTTAGKATGYLCRSPYRDGPLRMTVDVCNWTAVGPLVPVRQAHPAPGVADGHEEVSIKVFPNCAAGPDGRFRSGPTRFPGHFLPFFRRTAWFFPPAP